MLKIDNKDAVEFWDFPEGLDFLNHGSYGPAPKHLVEEKQEYIRKWNSHPDRFYESFTETIAPSLNATAEFIGIKPDELVLATNVTEALSAIANSIELEENAEILLTSSTYSAVKNIFDYIAQMRGYSINIVDLPYPINDDQEILDIFESSITDKTKMAVIDHISSPSAAIFPVKEMVEICKQRNIISVIDAAHAIGTLEVDIYDIAPDFYAGSLHKWCYVPATAAYLYVAEKYREQIHPSVISNSYGKGWQAEFEYTGTRDYSGLLVLPKAFEFYNSIGRQEIWDHNHNLVMEAGDLVADILGTECGTDESHTGFMRTVRVPGSENMSREQAIKIRNTIRSGHSIDVSIKGGGIEAPLTPVSGSAHLRLSAQIYNHIDQYERLAHTVKSILDGIKMAG